MPHRLDKPTFPLMTSENDVKSCEPADRPTRPPEYELYDLTDDEICMVEEATQ